MKILLLLLLVSVFLAGCSLLTLEELYCLPRRSEEYNNMQSLIDEAMESLTYCAPVSGEHRQSVQTADLDGDGVNEYLLFAKDESENPLKILIYSQVASGYVLMETIEGYGFAFDFVDYVQMDDKPGLEIVVGRQVSEELPRAVSVYRFSSGYAKQLLSTGYSGIACEDLNGDGMAELMLLTAGVSERGNGMAVLYTYSNDAMQRTYVSYISRPITYFQQVTAGMLQDGSPAVFVTSSGENFQLVLDVFAMSETELVNLTEGALIPSVRNYLIFPEDIDEDGVVEVPQPIEIAPNSEENSAEYILEWNAFDKNGVNQTKAYTYHHHAQGWYLFLRAEWIDTLAITRENDGVTFWRQDSDSGQAQALLTVYTLTGSNREDEAFLEGKIVLFKGDSLIYAAQLGEAAEANNITEENLLNIFHAIRQEWNTEEDGE